MVWAHTGNTLYRIDSGTLTPTLIGDLAGCGSVTDIAVSRDEEVYGISFTDLYDVNENNGACSLIGNLGVPSVNALTFAPSDPADPSSPEVLFAMGEGTVYLVDPDTAATVIVATLGGSLYSAGDLVWVPGVGLLGSASSNGMGGTFLIAVDLQGGPATVIGETLIGVLGLAMRSGILLGFASGGDIGVIDPETGAAVGIEPTGISFWGAGSSL